MANFSTIGILGGMGPEATNRLCSLITANTPATNDQDHIPVISYNNSRIPDRVSGLRGDGESPLPEMIRTAQVLEQAGADILLLPCNLAHAYLEDLRRAVQIPILDMIEETVKFIVANYPHCLRVGLLASTPTIEFGIYEKAFRRDRQASLLVPPPDVQEAKVMRAIYGSDGIKSGHKAAPLRLLSEAAQFLTDQGAEIIIAGCTEVSLVLNPQNSPFVVIDPLEVIARVAVELAMRNETASSRQKALTSNQG
ncbi:MAG: aspartate racemase [Acidobacteriota bacterium]|jgi:aspartate racemase|nr:aspartate racemase [Acidobacteriota bacterium]